MPVPATCADVRRDISRWAAVSVAAAFLLAIWPISLFGPMPVAAPWTFAEAPLVLAVLFAGAIADARTCEIPDAVPAAMAALHGTSGLACIAAAPANPAGAVLGGLAADAASGLFLGGGLLAFTLAYERIAGEFGMGGGDIKAVAAIGFAFGLDAGLAILFVACAAFAANILVQCARVRAGKGGLAPVESDSESVDAAPFGPSLALAALLVALAA